MRGAGQTGLKARFICFSGIGIGRLTVGGFLFRIPATTRLFCFYFSPPFTPLLLLLLLIRIIIINYSFPKRYPETPLAKQKKNKRGSEIIYVTSADSSGSGRSARVSVLLIFRHQRLQHGKIITCAAGNFDKKKIK